MDYKSNNIILYCAAKCTDLEMIKFMVQADVKNIKAIICDYHDSNEFKGIPVYKLAEIKAMLKLNKDLGLNDYTIVVTYASLGQYNIMNTRLKEIGLNEFEDYIQYKLYKKKIVVLWGNCHVNAVAQLLKYMSTFNKEYGVYESIELWNMKKEDVNASAIAYSDVILYQDILENNSIGCFASTSEMMKHVKPGCKLIQIPNLYGFGRFMFPQMLWPVTADTAFYVGNRYVSWFRDKYIDDYLQNHSKYKISDVIEYLMSLDLKEDVNNLYENFLSKLNSIDERSSFPISDFILNNYKKQMLFSDAEHPTGYVFQYYVEEICKMLNIEYVNVGDKISNYGHSTIVYPQIIKYLQLEHIDNCSRKYKMEESIDGSMDMDFEDYVTQYCMLYEYSKGMNKLD